MTTNTKTSAARKTPRSAPLPVCPAVVGLRDWARHRRYYLSTNPADPFSEAGENDDAYEARCAAIEAQSTSELGALFQMLLGMQASDMSGHPMGHRALLYSYLFMRKQFNQRDDDLDLAERYFFSGLGEFSKPLFPLETASAADWLARHSRKAPEAA